MYVHKLNSVNFRFNDLQAVLGIKQLEKIDKFIAQRIKIAERYTKEITSFSFQSSPDYATTHTHMLFFLFAENKKSKEDAISFLRSNGIDARLPYLPLHRQPCNSEISNSLGSWNGAVCLSIPCLQVFSSFNRFINTLSVAVAIP